VTIAAHLIDKAAQNSQYNETDAAAAGFIFSETIAPVYRL